VGLPYTSKNWLRLVPSIRPPCAWRSLAGETRFYSFWLGITLVFGAMSDPTLARCPSTLFGGEIDPPPRGPRESLHLFAKKSVGHLASWEQIPLQIDQVDQDGRLVLPGDPLYKNELDNKDLITFRTDSFGEKRRFDVESLPCRGPAVYQLSDPKNRKFAYLTQCQPPLDKGHIPLAASFEPEKNKIESTGYKYQFNPLNYLLFDNINFMNDLNQWEEVARDSQMLIRSDIKRFFTMQFDSSQIESKLEKTRLGPIANLARLSFFLRILFFRLDISLSTDVAFFNDSGHIPMMLNIPTQAHEWLNPRSGILYSWILSEKAAQAPLTLDMPPIDVETIKKGWKELAKVGLSYCRGEECLFRFAVNTGGRHLVMDLSLKRAVVERGFFPMFVADLQDLKGPMDWQLAAPKTLKRMGMYFEVSGLPKGGHPWNFWLKLGGQEAHEDVCPAPYFMKRLPS
jgi:hypothetical protein